MKNKKFTEAEFKEIKETLIYQAKARWPDYIIKPSGTKKSLDDCFTIDILKKGYIILFWYNVGKDTRIERFEFRNEKAHMYLKFNEEDKNNGI